MNLGNKDEYGKQRRIESIGACICAPAAIGWDVLVSKAMALSGRGHMQPVIEKELLHYDILFSLDKEGLLDLFTFQVGTCLRLCYKSRRFSEDLDFVGGRDFNSRQLTSMKDCLRHYICSRYELEVDMAGEIRAMLDTVGIYESQRDIPTFAAVV